MKCHYIYTEQGLKVLIPGCMAVAVSGRMEDCTCRTLKTGAQFEREKYNETIKALEQYIKELENENTYLNSIINKLSKQEEETK